MSLSGLSVPELFTRLTECDREQDSLWGRMDNELTGSLHYGLLASNSAENDKLTDALLAELRARVSVLLGGVSLSDLYDRIG